MGINKKIQKQELDISIINKIKELQELSKTNEETLKNISPTGNNTNIEIGGRNYIMQLNFGNDFNVKSFQMLATFDTFKDKENFFTISYSNAEIKKGEVKTGFITMNNNDGTIQKTIKIDIKNSYYKQTFQLPDVKDKWGAYIIIDDNNNQDNTNEVCFYDFQLEKGKNATDWQPNNLYADVMLSNVVDALKSITSQYKIQKITLTDKVPINTEDFERGEIKLVYK